MYANELLLGVPIGRDALKYWGSSGNIYASTFREENIFVMQENATLMQSVYSKNFTGKIKTLKFQCTFTADSINTKGFIELLIIKESDTVEQQLISVDATADVATDGKRTVECVLQLDKDDYVNTVGVKVKLKTGKLSLFSISLLQDSESFVKDDQSNIPEAQAIIMYGLDADKPKIK